MPYTPPHERELRVAPRWVVTPVEWNGEDAVFVRPAEPFVFGDTGPYSTAKLYACQTLRRNYDRMRVVDLSFENERVVSLTIAYRKAGS